MTLRDAVINTDLSANSIASLIHEAKIDVISVPQLLESLSTKEYEQKLLNRFLVAMRQKSMTNTLLLDGGNGDGKSGEKWDRKELSFTGLPDLLRLFLAVA